MDKQFIAVDLGPGRGERLAWLKRRIPHAQISGADYGSFMHQYLSFIMGTSHPKSRRGLEDSELDKIVKKEDFIAHLERFKDDSVDWINSDLSLGYYVQRGGGASEITAHRYRKVSIAYFMKVAEVAFRKLKPTPSVRPEEYHPPNKYFVVRLQEKENFQEIVEGLRRIGFEVKHRPLSELDMQGTDWLRSLSGTVEGDTRDPLDPKVTGRFVQIYAYKPGKKSVVERE